MKDYSYFVDTNIFLRTLLKDEAKTFRDCVKFLEKIKKGNLRTFTSALILAEVNWTLLRVYKFPKKEVIKGLLSIVKLKNLKIINNFDSRLGIEIYQKYPVKLIDALIASNPKIFQKKVIVVSYDKDFDKIGIKRLEPKKII